LHPLSLKSYNLTPIVSLSLILIIYLFAPFSSKRYNLTPIFSLLFIQAHFVFLSAFMLADNNPRHCHVSNSELWEINYLPRGIEDDGPIFQLWLFSLYFFLLWRLAKATTLWLSNWHKVFHFFTLIFSPISLSLFLCLCPIQRTNGFVGHR